MQIIHVITNQQHLDAGRLPGKVVVVLDILVATTTIAMALANGAEAVHTVREIEDARSLALSLPAEAVIKAGEKDAVIPPGFATFAPVGLSRYDLAGKIVVLVSTNGTVALANASGAAHIYAGALVNASATADHLFRHHREATILLVCAASKEKFNIEDFAGAGVLAELLVRKDPGRFVLTDAAVAARAVASRDNLSELLTSCRVGRLLLSMDLAEDVKLAADMDRFNTVVKQVNGSLRSI